MEQKVNLEDFYKILAEKYNSAVMNCGSADKMQQMTEILQDYVDFTFARFRDGLSQSVAGELLNSFDRAFSKFNEEKMTM